MPALLDTYVARLASVLSGIGKTFATQELALLRENVKRAIETGFQASPHVRAVFTYRTELPPEFQVKYAITLKEAPLEEQYGDWAQNHEAPLFGAVPDAKVMALAASLGDPASVPVLDVGAGTGRNTIPLARQGHPTDAVEMVPAMAQKLRDTAVSERVSVSVIDGDVLDPELTLPEGRYGLIVLSEVLSHFRGVDDVRAAFAKITPALSPGGLLICNVFLTSDGYKPDAAAREVSETAWSSLFTRNELAFLTTEFPLDKLSDESVHDFEKGHTPPDQWPPTKWFVDWTQGRNVFDLPRGTAPIELRWVIYRRR